MELNVVIVDDNINDLSNVKENIKSFYIDFDINFFEFNNPKDPEIFNVSPDIFFLDIDMNIPFDLIEVDLNNVITELGNITGKTTSEDVLDRIFSEFCIGK